MKIRYFYCNGNDPRIYVYKNEAHKWFGVTLNVAHPKSFLILAVTFASTIPFPVLLYLFHTGMALCIPFGFGIVWTIAISIFFFRKAEEDLRHFQHRN